MTRELGESSGSNLSEFEISTPESGGFFGERWPPAHSPHVLR